MLITDVILHYKAHIYRSIVPKSVPKDLYGLMAHVERKNDENIKWMHRGIDIYLLRRRQGLRALYAEFSYLNMCSMLSNFFKAVNRESERL